MLEHHHHPKGSVGAETRWSVKSGCQGTCKTPNPMLACPGPISPTISPGPCSRSRMRILFCDPCPGGNIEDTDG